MTAIGKGPFLFDTSAENWIRTELRERSQSWAHEYVRHEQVFVSVVTVMERIKGYELLWTRADTEKRNRVAAARIGYLSELGQVIELSTPMAMTAGTILGLLPSPPSPPRRSHRAAESKPSRLARWQNDVLIAATAIVARMPLVHNNPADFEAIRSLVDGAPERFPDLGPLVLIRGVWFV